MSNVSRNTVSLLAALVVFCIAVPADAQRKPKPIPPACGITAIPFIVGAEWTYQAVPLPNPPLKPLPKPKQPATVTIKVKAVEPQEDKTKKKAERETWITLEESIEEQPPKITKLVCKQDALNVPPESFFFSGEPGGGIRIELGELTRSKDSNWSYIFQTGKMVLPTWIEEMKVPFTRTQHEGADAKMLSGMLDLQRNVAIGGAEELKMDFGEFAATPMMVDIRGSLNLDLESGRQEYPIPANTISKLWFMDEIGLIQVHNTNAHMYQLVARVDPNAPPEEPAPDAGATGTPAANGAAKAPAAKAPAAKK